MASKHLEDIKHSSKEALDLQTKQIDFSSKQTTAFQQQLNLSAKQAEDIQKLIEISIQTAQSTAELANSTAKNEETSKRNTRFALWIAILSAFIALCTLISDYFGDAKWQNEQIEQLEKQNKLLESISEQLTTIERSDLVTSEDLQPANDKLNMLAEPK